MDPFRTRPLLFFLRHKRTSMQGRIAPVKFTLIELRKFSLDCKNAFPNKEKLEETLTALNFETLNGEPDGIKLSLQDYEMEGKNYVVHITTPYLAEYELGLIAANNKSQLIISQNGGVSNSDVSKHFKLNAACRPFRILQILRNQYPHAVNINHIKQSLAQQERCAISEKDVQNAIQQIKERLANAGFPKNTITSNKKSDWKLDY